MFENALNCPKMYSDSVQYIKQMDTSPTSVTKVLLLALILIQCYRRFFQD